MDLVHFLTVTIMYFVKPTDRNKYICFTYTYVLLNQIGGNKYVFTKLTL